LMLVVCAWACGVARIEPRMIRLIRRSVARKRIHRPVSGRAKLGLPLIHFGPVKELVSVGIVARDETVGDYEIYEGFGGNYGILREASNPYFWSYIGVQLAPLYAFKGRYANCYACYARVTYVLEKRKFA